MKAHVICRNDAIKAVVIGTEEFARQETARLRWEYLTKQSWPEDLAYFHFQTVQLIHGEGKTVLNPVIVRGVIKQ